MNFHTIKNVVKTIAFMLIVTFSIKAAACSVYDFKVENIECKTM